MKPRFLIFGIDGATFDIVDRLADAGRLPNLRALLARGVSARMTCTRPPHTAPGWASIVTARQPGGHGIYHFFDLQAEDYGAHIVGSGDFGCSTMWDWLEAQGWSLGLVNVPMSHPPRSLPGYQITWPLVHTLRFCSPASLLRELARNGAHFQSDLATMYRGDLAYIDEALANVEGRIRSFEYLTRAHPQDGQMIVFTEVDRVCHHYWHFADPTHPAYEAGAAATLRNAIATIYEAIDTALGRALQLLDTNASVVVVSDHGFLSGLWAFSVNRCLEKEGLLRTRQRAANSGAPATAATWFRTHSREIDWSQTALYAPVSGCFGVNVNLKGRQRGGAVSPSEFAKTRQKARDVLAAVRIPQSGQPAFATIADREEAFPGPACDRAADLLLVPRDERLIVTADIEAEVWSASPQTGLHSYDGVWIHASPAVEPRRLARSISIVDVAPTLLADVGARHPRNVQGRVVREAFRREVCNGPPLECDGTSSQLVTPTSQEDAMTAARLRSMGYL